MIFFAFYHFPPWKFVDIYKQANQPLVICLFVPSEPDDDDDDSDEIYGSIAYGAVGGPSAPSWTDFPPPSLLGLGKDDGASTTSPRGSPRKTPVTSPAKSGKSSPAVSPSKVREV